MFTKCGIVKPLSQRDTIANELYRIAIMQKDALNNVHITDEHVLITPDQLKAEFPLTAEQQAQIEQSRQTLSDIIAGRDPRLLDPQAVGRGGEDRGDLRPPHEEEVLRRVD